MRKRYTIEVTQTVEVDIDTDVMDETWLEEYRACMYNFNTHEEHAEHIAQMRARELFNEFRDGVEGYGDKAQMARVVPRVHLVPWSCETNTVEVTDVGSEAADG